MYNVITYRIMHMLADLRKNHVYKQGGEGFGNALYRFMYTYSHRHVSLTQFFTPVFCDGCVACVLMIIMSHLNNAKL